MKLKKIVLSIALAALLMFTLCTAACSDRGDPEPESYTVTFDYNYDGAPAAVTQTVESGAAVSEPEDPSREDYTFTGWYTASSCAEDDLYDFSAAVTADMTLYAGWTENVADCVVTFDYNYEGAPEAQQITVAYGGTVSLPEEPEREGDYVFEGWFLDAEATEPFDFTSSITEDITLHAGWLERTEGYSIATYYLNDGSDGVYMRVEFEDNSRLTEPATSPTSEGLVFDGWYEDAECTTEFNFSLRRTGDISIYAGWRTVYTFEAEYTDLTGKYGSGYSGSNSDLGLITADNTEHGTASNGYYVGWLYYTDAYLEFTFTADAAADDVTLVFRLSAEYDDLNATGDELVVEVNGTAYDFPVSIECYDILEMNTYGVKDFADYTLSTRVSVQEGENTVRFVINNSYQGSGATMNAKAPLIDCMYIYTTANLTLNEYTGNLD